MTFLLSGFKQDRGFRVYSFDGVSTNLPKGAFSVRVDLGLIQRHGIRLQELPLLCRGLLEQQESNAEMVLTYGEDSMRLHAEHALADPARRKKTGFKRSAETPAPGWRADSPLKTSPARI